MTDKMTGTAEWWAGAVTTDDAIAHMISALRSMRAPPGTDRIVLTSAAAMIHVLSTALRQLRDKVDDMRSRTRRAHCETCGHEWWAKPGEECPRCARDAAVAMYESGAETTQKLARERDEAITAAEDMGRQLSSAREQLALYHDGNLRVPAQVIRELRKRLADSDRRREEYRAEWEAACERLRFSDYLVRESQRFERDLSEAREALVQAEAGLADIGDAEREPGDDLAWCERRARRALIPVREALAAKPAPPAIDLDMIDRVLP